MKAQKVYEMKLAKVYPLLVDKAVKKGRDQSEVDRIICWLTGYDEDALKALVDSSIEYGAFFANAPALNPRRLLIKGVVCGVRVEAVEEPLMREMRYLDKLIDELAKGKALDKIALRASRNKPPFPRSLAAGGKADFRENRSAGFPAAKARPGARRAARFFYLPPRNLRVRGFSEANSFSGGPSSTIRPPPP